jgi:hypothetical protein
MAIMVDHVQMAALTLKKEMPMESRKTAGIVRLRIRQKCTVGGLGFVQQPVVPPGITSG